MGIFLSFTLLTILSSSFAMASKIEKISFDKDIVNYSHHKFNDLISLDSEVLDKLEKVSDSNKKIFLDLSSKECLAAEGINYLLSRYKGNIEVLDLSNTFIDNTIFQIPELKKKVNFLILENTLSSEEEGLLQFSKQGIKSIYHSCKDLIDEECIHPSVRDYYKEFYSLISSK